MGYSLRVNHKKLAGASHPRRDDQFRHITELRERCAADNVPVISVDTKKKELVGAFRNPGAKWIAAPNGSRTTTFAPRPRPRHPLRHLRPAGQCRHRLRRSMDGRGRCLDNVFIERLWRSLKYEAVYLHELADGFAAEQVISEWMTFYSDVRPHSALGGCTPAEAYREERAA